MAAMLVTLGVSLAMIGVAVARRQSATSRSHELGVGAEIDAARDVGAGDVEFDGGDAGEAVEPGRHADELLVRAAGDADDDRHAERGEIRQVVRDEGLDAVVIEADRVEHAGGGFDRSPRRVAGPRLLRDRLGQNAAQPAEIDQAFHLAGVAERARGDQDRIRQPQSAKLDGEIDIGRRLRHCGATVQKGDGKLASANSQAADCDLQSPPCQVPRSRRHPRNKKTAKDAKFAKECNSMHCLGALGVLGG